MKLFNVSWLEMLAALPTWSALERNQKLALLQAKPSGDQQLKLLQGEHEPLAAAGLIDLGGPRERSRGGFCIAKPWQVGQRVVRAMHRSRVLASSVHGPERHKALLAYLGEHYEEQEIRAICEQRTYVHRGYLAQQVADFSWIEGFLDQNDPRFQSRTLRLDACPPEEVELAREMVSLLIDRGGPIRLDELARTLAASTQQSDTQANNTLDRAIDLCLREVLLFAALDEDLDPILGIWPSTLERLTEGSLELRVFEQFAGTSYVWPFLIHDAVTVLVACLAEPARLKADFDGIYTRDQRRIESQLEPLPDWFARQPKRFGTEFHSEELRVTTAVRFATELELAEHRGIPGEDYRLEVTDRGRDWLGEPAAQRQLDVHDRSRDQLPPPGDEEGMPQSPWDKYSFFPGVRSYNFHVPVGAGVWQQALIEAYTDLADREIVLLSDFLKERARAHNPFKNKSSDRAWQYEPEQVLENLWAETIFRFFHERLLPLGALEIGFVSDDEALAFRLTEAGRYLLGQTDEFPETDEPPAAEVIVQPNFDIVFLAPSVEAEARLVPFAQQSNSRKKGSRVGLLFELTRESVLRGASGGLSGDTITSTLRQLSSSELPDNVEHQVRAWANRVRTLESHHAYLIDCLDLETANRVLAALGKKARAISDTVVEVDTGLILSTPIRKKLREAGLFIRERESKSI